MVAGGVFAALDADWERWCRRRRRADGMAEWGRREPALAAWRPWPRSCRPRARTGPRSAARSAAWRLRATRWRRGRCSSSWSRAGGPGRPLALASRRHGGRRLGGGGPGGRVRGAAGEGRHPLQPRRLRPPLDRAGPGPRRPPARTRGGGAGRAPVRHPGPAGAVGGARGLRRPAGSPGARGRPQPGRPAPGDRSAGVAPGQRGPLAA
jgi:hypothetical protein